MPQRSQSRLLHDGTISFGYGARRPTDDTLTSMEMTIDRLGLLLVLDHRLAARPEVRLADLEGERVILESVESQPELYADIVSAVHAQEVALGGLAEAADLEALLALVAIGDAVTFLPRRTEVVAPLSSVMWRPVVDLDLTDRDKKPQSRVGCGPDRRGPENGCRAARL